jgi:uncharacterized membrane-anchored protein
MTLKNYTEFVSEDVLEVLADEFRDVIYSRKNSNYLGTKSILIEAGNEYFEICLSVNKDKILFYKDDGDSVISIDEWKVEDIDTAIKEIREKANLEKSEKGIKRYNL